MRWSRTAQHVLLFVSSATTLRNHTEKSMRSRNDWLIRDDGDWHQTATIDEFQYMPAQQPNVSSCSLSSPTMLQERIGKSVPPRNHWLIRYDDERCGTATIGEFQSGEAL